MNGPFHKTDNDEALLAKGALSTRREGDGVQGGRGDPAVCVEVKVLLGGGGLSRAWVVESNWLLTRQTRKGEEVHAIGCTPNSTPSDSLTFREDR